ncbi:MAG TPA: HAMP domain-containing sensor histidine kinase [Cytophagaceae bacterium]|jgi:signal transduction histidine kinase|nr:HAMP domain-containing sensor histidine kinase [Cytophagaceae bacterium]
MWNIRRIAAKITHAGVNDAIEFEKQYRLKSMNLLCIIGILIISPYYVIFSLTGLWYPVLIVFLFHLSFLTVIFLNYLTYYNAGNYLLIFGTNMGILGMSYCIGFDSGFHLYFLTGPLFIFWIFDLDQKRYIAYAIGLEIFFVVLVFLVKYYFKPLYSWSDVASLDIYYLNMSFNLFLIFLLFYNYTKYYQLLTDSLVQKQRNLEEEVIKRIQSEEYTNKLFKDLSISYKNLEQFSYIVSHNVRAPLSNIKGFLSLYEANLQAVENDTVIESVRESAERLDEILMDLNVLLSAKNLLLENKREVNLSAAIQNVGVSLAAEIQSSGATIKEEFERDLNLVTIKTILHSILFNLFQNSIRHSKPDSRPEIIVRAKKTEEYTELTISDNGIGMDLEKYNDRVFMLYNTFGDNKEGRGIGLFLVKSNVEMLGGRIAVESAINVGTTFIIQFKN